MSQLFERHQTALEQAVQAIATRDFWTLYPEVPSEKIYGEGARQQGQDDFQALLQQPFSLPDHPGAALGGHEISPHGLALGIQYPLASADELINAATEAQGDWALASIEVRTGICLEILQRLNQCSFLMGHATMHTSGQGFPMAFQAGGPHAQDRGLEAVAYAWQAMTSVPPQAEWVKPMGRGQEVRLEKHWRVIPRGIGLVIGCRTFPTWNSYSGFFASLVTGNAVIAKPHPAAILPMALTVKIAREVLSEQGFSPNVVTLAAENPGQDLAQSLAVRPEIGIIDYTGSARFADWLRANAATDLLYTEETGVNSIVLSATDDFDAMCANLAFSLALYSGQMCTTPQNIFIPEQGIRVGETHKSYDEVVQGIVGALDGLLADPDRAAMIAGAIVNPDILAHIQAVQKQGRVLRPSQPYPEAGQARTASPLLVELDFEQQDIYGQEHFGPITFVIPVADVHAGIDRAADLARREGAITAALYAHDQSQVDHAIEAFAFAGVNLSINLLQGIYVNQSAAFSDFHVTGANPAGNACLTDNAFVANRYRVAMWRRPLT
ncbi:MAG TPA: phenylacetic acid degradation protein PaaN [Paenalcaligenes sp.]|nr:phenylacetic acid degradation protein PaaN [Paenalcaligenes sp.]